MADDPQTTLYQALCTSYNAINDWRAKLLGFLPLASGAGIFFLLNNSFTTGGRSTALASYLLPIGLVGAVVTFGLFVYDIRAIQVRRSLIEAGKEIEKTLGIQGQFSVRPHSFGRLTNDLQGSTLIYFTIIAGWIFFGLIFRSPQEAWLVAGIVFVIGVLSVNIVGIILAYKQE
jgi:hypothetical protein